MRIHHVAKKGDAWPVLKPQDTERSSQESLGRKPLALCVVLVRHPEDLPEFFAVWLSHLDQVSVVCEGLRDAYVQHLVFLLLEELTRTESLASVPSHVQRFFDLQGFVAQVHSVEVHL